VLVCISLKITFQAAFPLTGSRTGRYLASKAAKHVAFLNFLALIYGERERGIEGDKEC